MQTTNIKRTKNAKLNALIGSESMKIAKKKGDKLAIRAAKYKHLWESLKRKIAQKYKQKARANVYKSMKR